MSNGDSSNDAVSPSESITARISQHPIYRKLPRRVKSLLRLGWRGSVLLYELLENDGFIGGAMSLAGLGAGLLFLLISLIKPWFTVPINIVPSNETETGFQAVMQESCFTTPGRLIVFGSIVCLGLLAGRAILAFDRLEAAKCRVAAARIVATLFVLMLFFPWFALTWDVPLATHAAWLQDQHYNLTWLGGDVYNNAEGRDDIAKTGMVFSTNPLRTGIYALPDSRVGGLRLASLAFILEWLGYGMAFTQFDGQGWIFGASGCLIMLIGLMRIQSRRGESRMRPSKHLRCRSHSLWFWGRSRLGCLCNAGMARQSTHSSCER